jgi:aminoglycoside N3'-acetyltransferase
MTASTDTTAPSNRETLTSDLRRLGVRDGDVLMVHASLKAIGPVEGGADAVAHALLAAVGEQGTVMGYASWDRSPYEETLNGAQMDETLRRSWPAFDPETAGVYPGFGRLNDYLRRLPGARRSAHPDASMIAVGAAADWLVRPHRLGQALGPGSPLERFVRLNGRVLLLGAGPDAVTVLHYAEAVADIPNKRRVTIEMPVRDHRGRKRWRRAEEFDSNGILECYTKGPDAVEQIASDYIAQGRGLEGLVGQARSHLLEAGDLTAFGRAWLEFRHSAPTGAA